MLQLIRIRHRNKASAFKSCARVSLAGVRAGGQAAHGLPSCLGILAFCGSYGHSLTSEKKGQCPGAEEQAAAMGPRQQKPRCTTPWWRLLGKAVAPLPSKNRKHLIALH